MDAREVVLANLPDDITVVFLRADEPDSKQPVYEVRENGRAIGQADTVHEVAQILADHRPDTA